jgi:hypothetical protein
VTSPVRQGRYAAKFTVKNSANGTEPDDCDGAGSSNPVCTRRRTELNVQSTLPRFYDAMPYMSERWMSVSHFVPTDWDDTGNGFGVTIFQVKPLNDSVGHSNCFAIDIEKGSWTIKHRWSDVKDRQDSLPWQYSMFYAGNYDGQPYPRADYWPDGLADFPSANESHAALRSLNKGGWTDWVVHMKYDSRGSHDGGTGFLTVWKREGAGPLDQSAAHRAEGDHTRRRNI